MIAGLQRDTDSIAVYIFKPQLPGCPLSAIGQRAEHRLACLPASAGICIKPVLVSQCQTLRLIGTLQYLIGPHSRV